jgi:hypothetical protein
MEQLMNPNFYFSAGVVAGVFTILFVVMVVMLIVLWSKVKGHHENLQALQVQVDQEIYRGIEHGDRVTLEEAKRYIDSRIDKAKAPNPAG